MTKGDIFSRLEKLARNLRWTWNSSAQRLFASIDPVLWEATHRNPIKTMKLLSAERRAALASNENLAKRADKCERELARYLKSKSWFEREFSSKEKSARGRRPLIAYFCAEYGVHESLPQYSGGLGVLAGDHLKSASDLGVPLVAIGLLYRSGYYTQEFNADGTTRVIYPRIDFGDLPITDTGKIIRIPMGRRTIFAKIWKQQVGRVNLYLLDTDIAQNKSAADRQLTRHLYGGDREYRIQQEILLGIGGMIALDALELSPTVFHLNEGHAAFAALERLRRLRAKGTDLNQALSQVRDAGVFTTHTPVPAGNDRFSPELTMKYFAPMLGDLGLSRDRFLALGRENSEDKGEEFCMTVLALRLSRRCNGVARLHGEVSREMWKRVYNVDRADQVPIGHVTNGVHSQTWLSAAMEPLYQRYLKPQWIGAGPDGEWWKRRAGSIPPQKLWAARQLLRRELIEFIRRRLAQQLLRRGASSAELNQVATALDENTLTIGFARRFATYKRAPLVFHDPRRLAKIINNSRRRIQIIFAGKAHPKDLGGQEFARRIFKMAQSEPFRGRVVLLEDYDLEMGRVLTSGCDVWLNNPLRPQEASGTSGMKGPLHGGINCSIPDGWWPEGYNGRNGWMIGDGRQFKSQTQQDRYDAEAIYNLFEEEIAPLFYRRNRNGIPRGWVAMMIESMRSVSPAFSSHRMLRDYVNEYYMPAASRRHI